MTYMSDVTSRLESIKTKTEQLRKKLEIDAKKAELVELERDMEDPSFWSRDGAADKSRRFSELKEETGAWDSVRKDVEGLLFLANAGDAEFEDQLEGEYAKLEERFSKLEFSALLSGRYDSANALVSIHAGTGGVDAMDWAEMLLRMIVRYAESRAWTVRILDQQKGGEAGIKTVVIEVIGRYAYGYLKAEHGVHRLVRISPFDAEGMRHTSFALIEVIPDMGEVEETAIKPEDLKIDVFRAGGHGGQSVNTTDSAVRITHIATGIVVTCQNERSQLQNKETALRYLRAKLRKLQEAEQEEERKQLRGAYSEAAWGNQIRSYVLNPYRMVKDHRTGVETHDVHGVLDGDLTPFIEAYLRRV